MAAAAEKAADKAAEQAAKAAETAEMDRVARRIGEHRDAGIAKRARALQDAEAAAADEVARELRARKDELDAGKAAARKVMRVCRFIRTRSGTSPKGPGKSTAMVQHIREQWAARSSDPDVTGTNQPGGDFPPEVLKVLMAALGVGREELGASFVGAVAEHVKRVIHEIRALPAKVGLPAPGVRRRRCAELSSLTRTRPFF